MPSKPSGVPVWCGKIFLLLKSFLQAHELEFSKNCSTSPSFLCLAHTIPAIKFTAQMEIQWQMM